MARLGDGICQRVDGPDGEVQTVPGGVAEFDFDVELAEGSASYTMHGQDAEKLALKPTAWKVRGVVDNLPAAKFDGAMKWIADEAKKLENKQ